MKIPSNGKLLRVFINEKDHWGDKPLYEAILEMARERQMAGATVLRAMAGFGADSHMHTSSILRLADELPLIIEIVDSEEKIQAIMPCLDRMIKEGLVTIEKAEVLLYRPKGNAE